ncbi:MAG: hypothetical protein N0E48_18195, partial [Candidatus Thiodiazotropha endolucinida]|nr:hypothetical protein [Candidatus Thiodiazotropha taylori]MCW4345266.1 hypothetical protein [Candidatus Thiodiazotropha endolucinida]
SPRTGSTRRSYKKQLPARTGPKHPSARIVPTEAEADAEEIAAHSGGHRKQDPGQTREEEC